MFIVVFRDGSIKKCHSLTSLDANTVDWENTVLIPGYKLVKKQEFAVVKKVHKLLKDMEYYYNLANNKKATIWNQGQPLDGISELAAYRELAEQAINLLHST